MTTTSIVRLRGEDACEVSTRKMLEEKLFWYSSAFVTFLSSSCFSFQPTDLSSKSGPDGEHFVCVIRFPSKEKKDSEERKRRKVKPVLKTIGSEIWCVCYLLGRTEEQGRNVTLTLFP